MNSEATSNRSTRTRMLWLMAYLAAVAGMVVLRLSIYEDRVVPLTYGLPLLLCLVSRDVRALYGMAIAFSLLAVVKAVLLMADGTADAEAGYEYVVLLMQWTNIWVVAGVVHGVLAARRQLEEKNEQLALMNHELEASNEELAAREEEISRQNEELQSQAEELEQQTEELRQQTQEMEHQSAELHATNGELAKRESGLQTLLSTSRWLRPGIGERQVLDAICQVVGQLLPGAACAAAIVDNHSGVSRRRGCWQVGHGPDTTPYGNSFAAIVAESGQTAYIQDIATRPDLTFARSEEEITFRSVLGAPVRVGVRTIAVIEVYCQEPRDWTVDEFRVVEWLAAQASLALQAVSYQQHLLNEKRVAERATIQKTQFLAAVSHDVRTPVNAISLLADIIEQEATRIGRDTDLPAAARDLKNNARSLVDLVSDVLDLARLDSGKLELQTTTFSVSDLVTAEIRQQYPLAVAKGLSLVADLPEKAAWIKTDKMKLARVLSNLIGNALKFTERGEVRVRCQPLADGSVDLVVQDTGVGISPDQASHIFDEFYQIQNPERDRNKGTGLGLAICRRLIDHLGCSITLRSVVGKGSTFTVRIPCCMVVTKPEAPAELAPARAASDSRFSDLRILLVEDHDPTRRAAARLLTGRGAEVLQAPNGRTAMHMLAHEEPDVLLLDLMLPDMDGAEVLRHLQTMSRQLRCVLAVSGDVREDRIREVRQLGAHDLVAKPLNIEHLLETIQKHLDKSSDAEEPACSRM